MQHPPFWIHGLKRKGANAPRGMEWYRRIALIITGDYTQIERSPKTIEAEAGLGIPPSVYFFISSPVKDYSNGLFLYTIQGETRTASDSGVTPFDSGGLWSGQMHTNPHLASAESKREFYRKYHYSLRDWRRVFRQYISEYQVSFETYVDGLPPKASPTNPKIIVTKPPNREYDWIWEGRIQLPPPPEILTLSKFVCRRDKLGSLKANLQKFRRTRLIARTTVHTVTRWTKVALNVIVPDNSESTLQRTRLYLKEQGFPE